MPRPTFWNSSGCNLFKGGVTNLKMGGSMHFGRCGGGVNTVKTLKFDKREVHDPPS